MCVYMFHDPFLERDPPPIADAGEDVTIQLPTDSVNLNGLGSTDNEAIVQYEWAVTVISGSDGFEFLDSDTATPSLSGLAAGEYEVNLVVTDSRGQQDTDTLTIIVKGDEHDKFLNESKGLIVGGLMKTCFTG